MKPLLAVFCAAALCTATNAAAITVRSTADGRVWQTKLDGTGPIRWPWIDGADSARVTVSSLCKGKTASAVVAREAEDACGEYALPTADVERLYDLTLEYLSNNTVVRTETARVAVLPPTFAVRPKTSGNWTRAAVRHPMFAWDPGWTTGEVASVALSQQVGAAAPAVGALDAAGGYDVADSQTGAATLLSLLYDGEEAFAGSFLYSPAGLLFFFR